MNNHQNILSFDTKAEQDLALAKDAAQTLSNAINEKGAAILVVSGGSTPLDFFKLLSEQDLTWSKVTITLADERWVTAEHDDSNEKLVRENLLVNKASSANFTSLVSQHNTAYDGEDVIEQRLSKLGSFDLLILGMGDDGHTASLFPGATALNDGLDMTSDKACLAVTPLHAPHQRISMTLPRLLDSQRIIIHIRKTSKMNVLQNALAGTMVEELPVRAILQQQQTPVDVYYAP